MDGRIKATYAELFDRNGRKVFSMQKADMGNNVVVTTDQLGTDELVPVRLTQYAIDKIRELSDGKLLLAFDTKSKAAQLYAKQTAFNWGNGISNKKLWIAGALLVGLALISKK